MNSGKFLFGIISGFVTGVVIGTIFAPDKGSNTRRRILERGDDYSDIAKEKFLDYVEIINDKLEKIKKDVAEYSELVKGRIKEYEKSKDSTMN